MSLSDINKDKKNKIKFYGRLVIGLKAIIDKGGSFEDLDFSNFDEADRPPYIKALRKYAFYEKNKGIDL